MIIVSCTTHIAFGSLMRKTNHTSVLSMSKTKILHLITLHYIRNCSNIVIRYWTQMFRSTLPYFVCSLLSSFEKVPWRQAETLVLPWHLLPPSLRPRRRATQPSSKIWRGQWHSWSSLQINSSRSSQNCYTLTFERRSLIELMKPSWPAKAKDVMRRYETS